MNNSTVIIVDPQSIKEIFKNALREVEEENRATQPCKLLTINQVAKMLGRAHETIKKLTVKGVIKTTKDGLIPESAVNEYLGQDAKY
jgi:excisionase family DNA binding protein